MESGYSQTEIEEILSSATEKAKSKQEEAEKVKNFQPPTPQQSFDRPEVKEDLSEPGEHNIIEANKLNNIGKATTTFEWEGNRITIRTLNNGEELEILSRVDAFPATARGKALSMYQAAICLEAVNGEPFFKRLPVSKDDDIYTYKFEYFRKEMFSPVVNQIIKEFNKLKTESVKKGLYAKKK
jgi:hypothetical protein